MEATITFYGGAGGVTGSKHLLDVKGKRILLDCGTFQGLPDVRERNRSLPFAPESIDYVVLSHAHIDHCGMLPLLVKRGFTGSIFATPATCDVAELMLQDAAGIEESDAEYRRRHHIGAPDEREPLFTRADIPATVDRFVPVPYNREHQGWTDVFNDVRLKFYDAGHILGSAITVLEFRDGDEARRVVYTGDMGPKGTPILYDPQLPEEDVDTLIMESTYGSRVHEGLDAAVERLAQTVREVCERRGKMIVPAFSLGRTQVLIYLLHKLTDEGKIPRFPIYVDSPLAVNLTDVYRAHRNNYDEESWNDFNGPADAPLTFSNLVYVDSVDESKKLNSKRGPLLIVSASGMMTAGRVVHHLRHSISDSNNAIFVTGYQAEGTLGRRLLEGAKRAELYGDWFDVRAQIYLFNEFSAHADRNELQDFADRLSRLSKIFLVHGEPHQADDLKAQLVEVDAAREVVRPNEGDSDQLFAQ